MKEKLYIIKIGGALIDDEELLTQFLEQFSEIQEKKILVHGGGKLATTLADKLGIEQKMINGRRITDKDTLDIVTMVYAGGINKNIVEKLQQKNCNAIGFSGADGNLIKAKKREHPDIDFGFVGDINKKSVNKKLVSKFMKLDLIPVFSAITHDKKGNLFNTNADTIASVMAQALSSKFEVELLYCFDKEGVLENVNDPESLIKSMNGEDFDVLKKEGKLHKGILPKLENALGAIKNNVNKVFLIKETQLKNHIENHHAGTEICL
ncbi:MULTISPECIES: acetylglutamate kinase [Chryseobacterium]|jgi:acetylglutamate kinase|uniref:Acetylglutamate kinase n=2 Tax=Chryseobacterium TaxID=59732 RepID=A0AAE3Y5J5_9FLAO|nr:MULTISPECIES: acetylglutamate kinase [Chryseobacterium]MBL3546023.1 acetylglutamate kinase [Chryseobacterium sp. KMC2]MDR6525808.1 acetylglutamate kinase [Chryseobacterium rhizosphaerae]MDR6545006.1 acetylglutamate kinase [Chryseobacterium rhizosphaerae]REC73391.1 acetylglutamate kinase [Chryseobacterium rhizosphaerae]